ncbi:hypothetical protein ABW21_db0203331 [Orbilia brochopaga]|nr:hypothetical protein ABW21_db0203331 [Drechslerella brochopaga]
MSQNLDGPSKKAKTGKCKMQSSSMKTKFEDVCFCCKLLKVTARYRIAPQEDKDYKYFQNIGVLPLGGLSSTTGIITLCKPCSMGFSYTRPFWYILPLNLNFFIDFEKHDYEEREALFRQDGIKNKRKTPNAIDYHDMLVKKGLVASSEHKDGLYNLLVRREFLHEKGTGVVDGDFYWSGHPMVVLIHLFKALKYPGKLLDENIRSQLLELVDLYEREDPWLDVKGEAATAAKSGPAGGKMAEEGDDDGDTNRQASARDTELERARPTSLIVESEPTLQDDNTPKTPQRTRLSQITLIDNSDSESFHGLPVHGPSASSPTQTDFYAKVMKFQ